MRTSDENTRSNHQQYAEPDDAVRAQPELMPIRVIESPVRRAEIAAAAADQFDDLVKAVVDIARGVMAIGGELHSDEEALLLERGSRQRDLWGINLYPSEPDATWIELDSMINVRPSQGNRSRGVEDPEVQNAIRRVVASLVQD